MRAVAIITIITLLSFPGNVSAQKGSSGGAGYNTGIGLRFGWDAGVSVKHFIKSDAAIEGIIGRSWGYRGFRITGLYEFQRPFSGAENLYWFVGGGAHFGMYRGHYWGRWKDKFYYEDRYYPVIGLDLIGGIEYKFASVPFTVGVDVKPYVDFVGWGGHFWDGAFTARYAF